VLDDLQAEFGMAPAAEENEKAKCSTAAFPKLFMFRERSRKTGFSCYNVTPLPQNRCSASLFPTGYKRLLKEEARFFDVGLMEGCFDGGWVDWLAAELC
jgi:hypothetical protein